MANPHLFLSRSPFFSIALHPFRDSASAQHRTLFGCSTCTFDTVLTQRRRFKGAPAVGRRSGDIMSARIGLLPLRCRGARMLWLVDVRPGMRSGTKESSDGNIYGAFSGNNPGIQRAANAAGKVRRSGARGVSDTSTPLSTSAETMRRACRSPVPTTVSASPRGSSPR